MRALNFSKGNLRYLSISSQRSVWSYSTLSSPAKFLVSASRPFFGIPICNKLHSLISSFGSFSFKVETYPSSHSLFLCKYYGCISTSSFFSNGLPSVCSIPHPCSRSPKSSKFIGLGRFSYRYDDYTNQNLNFYLFSYLDYGYFRLYSVPSPDASQYEKLPIDGLRRKATPEQVSLIIGVLVTEDSDLTSKLNSLNVILSIASVKRVFQVLNSEKKPALHFFSWIRHWQPELERHSDICSLVINNCGHLDDYNAMRSLLNVFSLNRLSLTKKAFEYLQVFTANEDLLKKFTQNVVGILQEVGGTSYGTGVHSLVEMFTDLGSFDMAKFVIERTGRKLSYYNVLVREMSRRCNFKAARNLMDEMREAEHAPSNQTYNYVISSLLKNGKHADACEVFREMEDKDCPPDALTYEILICNYCSDGKLDKAIEFFDEMVARGIEPRLSTHAALIRGFFNSQQYDKAYKYAAGSDHKYASSLNYSLLAELHRKRGKPVIAENILSEMIKKGLRPHFGVHMRVKRHLSNSGKKKLATDLQKKYLQLEHQL